MCTKVSRLISPSDVHQHLIAQERAEQAPAKIASQDDESCGSYGAAPGTQAYITCRTQLQAARIGAPPPVNVSVAPARRVYSARPMDGIIWITRSPSSFPSEGPRCVVPGPFL
jgi:hypothetical protein